MVTLFYVVIQKKRMPVQFPASVIITLTFMLQKIIHVHNFSSKNNAQYIRKDRFLCKCKMRKAAENSVRKRIAEL